MKQKILAKMTEESIIPDRKCKVVKLFGEDLLLMERMTWDVMQLEEFNRNNENIDPKILAAYAIKDSLKFNYENLKLWYFIKKYLLKKKLSFYNLLQELSENQIFVLYNEILLLEGTIDENLLKKNEKKLLEIFKKLEQLLADKLQKE